VGLHGVCGGVQHRLGCRRRARLEDVVANSDLVFPVRRLEPDGLAIPAVAGGGHSRLRGATDSGDVDGAGEEFERLLMAHLLRHTGSPVMRWMVTNVIVTMAAAGNIMPNKDKSGNKIDGVSAAIVALERTLVHAGPRVYDERPPLLVDL
jgi:hypothetical protein